MQPSFKYVDIKVDFPPQKKRVLNKLHKAMTKQDFYMAWHTGEFYSDGLRIEGLKSPWISIEWLNNLLFELDIPATLIEFYYYHPYSDWHDESTLTQSVNPRHCIPCRRT